MKGCIRANYSSGNKNSTGKDREATLITASGAGRPKWLEQRESKGDLWMKRLKMEAEATSGKSYKLHY